MPQRAAAARGRMRSGPAQGSGSGSGDGVDLTLLQWMDAEEIDGFVDWSEFQHPTFSADGSKIIARGNIAGEGKKTKKMGFGVLSLEGELLHTYTLDEYLPEGTRYVQPKWSPDGRYLTFGAKFFKQQQYLMKNVIQEK